MIVVTFVATDGMSGRMDASTTRNAFDVPHLSPSVDDSSSVLGRAVERRAEVYVTPISGGGSMLLHCGAPFR